MRRNERQQNVAFHSSNFSIPPPCDVIHYHFRIIISTPFLTFYFDHPLYNDDGVASDIIITRRVWPLRVMDIPTVTKRCDCSLPAAQMRNADSRMCKRMYGCRIAREALRGRNINTSPTDRKKGDCTKGGEDGLDGMRTFASRKPVHDEKRGT